MIYNNNDDYLHRLNKPLLMADLDDDDDLLDDDFDDEPIDEDNDDDLDDVEDDHLDEEAAPTGGGGAREESQSKGITRNSLGFGALVFAGVLPIIFMLLYMIKGGGLSLIATVFMGLFILGFGLSIWTFLHYQSGVDSFTRFDLHSYFKWPEIAVIAIVLISVSLFNLANLHSGNALHLSAQSLINVNSSEMVEEDVEAVEEESPEPIFAPAPPQGFEFEEEVLYTSPEFSTKNSANSATKPKPTAKPATNNRVFRPVRAATRQPVRTARRAPAPVKAEAPKPNVDELVDSAIDIAEISATNYVNKLQSAPPPMAEESGSATGQVSSIPMEVETPPIVTSLFLGGVLMAALGYAFPLALAGALLGLFRKFNHPFAAKVKEIIDEETGEVTLETEGQTTVNKILDHVFRFMIGFSLGGTLGFILGLIITVPLYFLFWDQGQTDPVIANFLIALGVVKNPDLAYATGIIVAGFVVPVVMLIGKATPAGMSISEEKVRQVYSIPVTIRKSSTDMTTIPEPAIINFNLDDDEGGSEGGMLDDDFDGDDRESLTQELISEFGSDLENVFGMKVDMPSKSNGNGSKISNYERQKVNNILEKSLGELGNVTVQVSAELGKANIMLTDWLNLSEGMLIELDKPATEEIDILINDVSKGKGKLTVIDNHLAVEVSKAEFSQSNN